MNRRTCCRSGAVAIALLFAAWQPLRAENEPRTGWHALNYYGVTQNSIPDFWDELADPYGDGELNDVFEDEHGLWGWGYPVGYSIGAGCRYEWPFGPGPRCCLTPLYYRDAAPTAFPTPRPERPGLSWYRTASVPASNRFYAPPVAAVAPVPAPAQAPSAAP